MSTYSNRSSNDKRRDTTTLLSGASRTEGNVRAPPAAAAAAASTSFSDSGIAAVASRIQDRAHQLCREQETLQTTRDTLRYEREILDEERVRSTKVHQELLKSSRNSCSVELEYLKIQEQIQSCQKETGALMEECKLVEEALANERTEWESLVLKNQFARHKTKQALYEKNLQAAIAASEKAKADREIKIRFLQDEADRFESDRDWALQQQEQASRDMEGMAQQQQEENKIVEELAQQVRSALQKVRSLRGFPLLSTIAKPFFP